MFNENMGKGMRKILSQEHRDRIYDIWTNPEKKAAFQDRVYKKMMKCLSDLLIEKEALIRTTNKKNNLN